jgi:uncharacterized protein
MHRAAPAIAIALATLMSAAAFAQRAPIDPLIRIPASEINSQPIAISTATRFHTLASDFFMQDDGTMYVQTGDIPAMWLRDSSSQTKPYVRFSPSHPKLGPLVRAVIERNAKNVLTDPYANAFTAGYKIWEEKWEVDSLAYPVTLAYTYWRRTNDRALFTPRLHWALEHTVSTYLCEQQHAHCSHYTSRFLPNGGRGARYAQTGMIWSAFRPSDDRVRYPFNIPQQMFAVVALRELSELALDGYRDARLAGQASRLADEVNLGIERHGLFYSRRFGLIYAYEVDGLGNALVADDANMPNLTTATYYGYAVPFSQVYLNTRRFALSSGDPYFYRGKYAAGLGSAHSPTGWVWPLGLMGAALTTRDPREVAQTISTIEQTNRENGLIHESFDPNNPDQFTRAEFGWANALYAELLFRTAAGFDADPLPPIPGVQFTPQSTPVIVGVPQLWFNADLIYSETSSLLQE